MTGWSVRVRVRPDSCVSFGVQSVEHVVATWAEKTVPLVDGRELAKAKGVETIVKGWLSRIELRLGYVAAHHDRLGHVGLAKVSCSNPWQGKACVGA